MKEPDAKKIKLTPKVEEVKKEPENIVPVETKSLFNFDSRNKENNATEVAAEEPTKEPKVGYWARTPAEISAKAAEEVKLIPTEADETDKPKLP